MVKFPTSFFEVEDVANDSVVNGSLFVGVEAVANDSVVNCFIGLRG